MSKWAFALIAVVSIILGWQLFRPGYYPMHDDLQVMRMYQMDICFKDGQIPCRWARDMGNGFGQPMFNYYSAFPYYLGQAFRQLGLQYVDIVKIVFFLSLFVSGLSMYLLSSIFLSTTSSVIASIAYLTFPYHALDIFVRGALSESWGLALVPLTIYSCLNFLRQGSLKKGLSFSTSLSLLLMTHNLTTLFTAPLLVIFVTFSLLYFKLSFKNLIKLIPYGILGLGLGAFFWLPLSFEKNLIQSKFFTLDYFDYHAHFVSVSQLFTKPIWGYGPSKFGVDDDLSFYFGLIPTLTLFLSPLLLLSKRVRSHPHLIVKYLFFVILTFGFLLLTHNKSVLLWEKLPLISFAQFPWRFLGQAALMGSLLIGLVYEVIAKSTRMGKRLFICLTIGLIISNFSFFTFEKYFYWIDDKQKLSGELFNLQARAALLDYLPETSVKIPDGPSTKFPELLSGRANINYFENRSNFYSSEFDVYTDEIKVKFPIMYFPGWTFYLDRNPKPIKIELSKDYGQPEIILPKGHHLVQAFFEDTPIRKLANWLTIISFLILVSLYIYDDRKNQ